MGKLNIFELTLSNLESTYYAGQNVEGHCTIELTDDMSLKGVKVQLKGQAKVSWVETVETGFGDNRRREYITKSDRELYAHHTVQLLPVQPTDDKGEGSIVLPMGRHVFPFSILLPPDCPSTFFGKHGHVNYSLTATITRRWSFEDKTEKGVVVIGRLDLNQEPKAELPTEKEKEKMVCCLCCESGPIIAKFRLLRLGHILGEPLQFEASVANNSKREIVNCSISLIVMTSFHAESSSEYDNVKALLTARGSIPQNTCATWRSADNETLVPHLLPPSGMPGCKLIDVDYCLKLSVYIAGSSTIGLILPIIIGTIPLRYARPARPIQVTPQTGYSVAVPPGFEPFINDSAATTSAPVPESEPFVDGYAAPVPEVDAITDGSTAFPSAPVPRVEANGSVAVPSASVPGIETLSDRSAAVPSAPVWVSEDISPGGGEGAAVVPASGADSDQNAPASIDPSAIHFTGAIFGQPPPSYAESMQGQGDRPDGGTDDHAQENSQQ